jgi:UDP-N-acetylglucosamine 2-epimerase
VPRPSGEGDLLAFAAREPVVPADCLRLHLSVEVTIYGNLPRPYFVNLLRCARLLAGDSSAGLLEAPSVPLAVVNIGRRQRGRRAAGNVVFADVDRESIRAAIDTALSPAFQHALRSVVNPYGDGRSAPRACELLKTIDFPSLLRKPEDPLRPDQGH